MPGGSQVVGPINRLMREFQVVVMSQDWHPPRHSSFASGYEDRDPYGTVELHYGTQVLWPDHCVQGTAGARFHPDLDTDRADAVIRKGFRTMIDSYSAFFENDRQTPTGLAGYLRERGFERLYLAGLATDFCVAYSALDAVRLGFAATVLEDACRAIDLDGSLAEAMAEMTRAGVAFDSAARLAE